MSREHRDEAAPFAPEELFFSRTDKRGIIKGGNHVFRRVSGYDWPDLIGAPHKILRHDDMPKGVFWQMWHTIEAGNPIGVYVKNRAKDGRYYWVFAIVTVLDDEYISVRLKPTSPLLEKVKALYATLLKAERKQGLTPEQSAQALLAGLAEMDFPDYASFSAHAFVQEVRARDVATQRPPDKRLSRFVDMLTHLEKIRREGRSLVKGFASIEGAPKNMRIQASRMGIHAAPLGVISTNFDEIAGNIKTGIEPFINGLEHLADAVGHGLTVNCSCSLLSEVLAQYESDPDGAFSPETLAEIAHLKDQRPRQMAKSHAILRDVMNELHTFSGACRNIKQTLSGLSMMRVMGEIESARIGDTQGSLKDIVTQLQRFQTAAEASMYAIEAERGQIEIALQRELETKLAA
ncbi:PAS domain-containing protein [Rhodobacteraceae bacterium N5(2021)]|uniref:PAS domain-containing protein n=1 Tax=Gymnodinialimonas phycosphaerae TaxID=2841589 RepID=A0A975TWX6_9RHOB|nr:PAS domain-containing protein [Gymnodinialimonas phycosphaerae]MBY4892225.1 PAS domain-containing protein [Gymnodinialimonas phycosphaerae]